MVQDHNCNCFGQRLISFMRAAALPAALGMLWHAPCAFAQESQKTESPAASSSTRRMRRPFPRCPQTSGVCLSLKLLRRSIGTSRHWFTSRSKPSRSPGFSPMGSVTNIGPIMEPCPAR